MTNWEKRKEHLNNFGILTVDNVPKDVLDYVKNNYDTNNSHNEHLAGQIKREYEFKDWPQYIDKFILDQTNQPLIQKHTQNISVLSSNKPFYLKSLWINLQKKYEFNPMHKHIGVFSFIIFLKIPYNLDEEDKVFPKSSGPEPATSRLVFIVNDFSGAPRDINVNVDKSFEGKMLMFPAGLNHMVYPFYTSDDYRMTVSGNISFWVEEC